MKEKINAALDRFYTNSLLAVPVTVLVFYAGWSLIGVLIPSIVPQYALKLVYGLIFSAAFLRFRKGHMYPALRNRHGFKVLLWMLPNAPVSGIFCSFQLCI